MHLAGEVIGYIGRILNANEDPGCWTLGPYVMQSLLILLAPPFMAASIYMILGRIIQLTEGEPHALIRRQWLTKIFVLGDVLSLLMQGSGGGMMAAKTQTMIDLGENLIVAGLFVQLAFFGCFVAVAAVFHLRMARRPTPRAARDPAVRWRTYLATLYVASGLILVRSVFRVVEYIMGNDSVLMRSEVYLYVFDTLLMLVVFACMNWFHPSEIGLLLRGERPVTNGLELIGVKRPKSEGAESLSSEV